MKVKDILKEAIKGIGKKDEIVEVKDGYANNFLLNLNKAVLATPENINKLKSKDEKTKRVHDNEVKKAEEIKSIIDSKVITLKVKAGENGKVFGSIGGKEIAEAVKVQLGVEIDKKKISSDSRMKELGQHEVEVKLHHEVKAKIKVKLLGGE